MLLVVAWTYPTLMSWSTLTYQPILKSVVNHCGLILPVMVIFGSYPPPPHPHFRTTYIEWDEQLEPVGLAEPSHLLHSKEVGEL